MATYQCVLAGAVVAVIGHIIETHVPRVATGLQDVASKVSLAQQNIHKDNICFHLGVLDYEHYYKGKATNHDGNQMGEKHEEALKSAKDNYINFYSNPHSNFKLITDNYIKKYKI